MPTTQSNIDALNTATPNLADLLADLPPIQSSIDTLNTATPNLADILAQRVFYTKDLLPTRISISLNWSTMYYGQLKEKKVTALIAIDLSAAFNTADHNILISVLQTKFGVKGKALDWYKSCLNDRTSKVNVGNEYSTPRKLLFSVPQGSCGRPVLYLRYSSTIREVIPDSTISSSWLCR